MKLAFGWLHFVFAALFSVSAHAGSADRYRVVGFSADNRVFVFEQFGDFDVAPGGHSTYYFVDLERDEWLPGTPIGVSLGDGDEGAETTTIDQLRSMASEKSRPLIASLGVSDPGFSLAKQSFGQAGATPHRLAWQEPYFGTLPNLKEQTNELRLETFNLSANLGCDSESAKGFRLMFNGRTVHEDTTVPKSRSCPVDYFIEEVINDVAVIAVFSRGFEGHNRKYIAVPMRD